MVTARVRKDCSMASSLKNRLEKFYFAASGDECWLWRGATTGKPTHQYGMIKVKGKMIKAHRLSYELYNRTSIPTGMVIDHICRVTRCVTRRINSIENSVSLAAINAQKTHCKMGHELSPGNTIIRKYSGKFGRECAICYRERIKRASIKKKAPTTWPGIKHLSKIKGAYYDKRDGTWFSAIQINRVLKYLGRFDSQEKAREAYLKASEARILGEGYR